MLLSIFSDFIFGWKTFFMHNISVSVHYLFLGCTLLEIMCSFAASFYVNFKK
jgi:uncharacterized membrane protein